MSGRGSDWRPKRRSSAHGVIAVATVLVVGMAFASASAAAVDLGGKRGLHYWYEEGSTPIDPGEHTFTLAECPGDPVVGGGAGLTGPADEAHLSATVGYEDGADGRRDDAWYGEGMSTAGSPKGLDAWAICRPSGRSGLRYDYVTKTADPSSGTRISARCEDSRVVSGGIYGSDPGITVNTTAPFDGGDDDTKPDDGWTARIYNSAPATAFPAMSIVCARPRVGELRYRSASDAPGTDNVATPTALCPDRTAVIGGGFSVKGPADAAWLSYTAPNSDDLDGVPSDGWVSYAYRSGAGASAFRTQAICLH
jgi:hypothetical protein